ncbi:Sestrin-1 [Folsomia candida]|uniref:Sestrin-1 n=1 Tax=Folsomia candida TaxID=158441 RepID=A0A226DYB3_FOLCA|nr:Sestrin-1 [Folsomia candida]
MVIPTPSPEEAVAVSSSASIGGSCADILTKLGTPTTTSSASIPIPPTPMSMPNGKLSSSAPADKMTGFELLARSRTPKVLATSISATSGISALETGLQQQRSHKFLAAEFDPEKEQPEQNQQPVRQPLISGIVVVSPPNVTTNIPTTMDLEPSDRIMEKSSTVRWKYTDPDLPPHLSEVNERNVIAILNRCDPERGRRCFSCGYDNTEKWLSNNQNNGYSVDPEGYFGHRKNSVGGGYDDEPYFWTFQQQGLQQQLGNSTTSSRGGGGGGGYFQNQPQQQPPPPAWSYNYFDGGDSAGFYHNNYHHSNNQQMSESGRKRFYSDGGSGSNTNSDLDIANAMEDEEVFTFDMAYHPDYLEIFLKTHHFLMRGDGPLPYNHRNYIAIMCAGAGRLLMSNVA